MPTPPAPPAGPAGTVEGLPFEEAIARLEAIVKRLEGGDVPLEESLVAFEEGVRLSRLCAAHLDDAERKVALLLKEGDSVTEVDFGTGEVLARRPAPTAGDDEPGDDEVP